MLKSSINVADVLILNSLVTDNLKFETTWGGVKEREKGEMVWEFWKEDNSTQVLLEEKIEIKIAKMLSELNTYREQLATATLICYYITSDNIFMPIMLL